MQVKVFTGNWAGSKEGLLVTASYQVEEVFYHNRHSTAAVPVL